MLITCLIVFTSTEANSQSANHATLSGVAIHTLEEANFVIQTDRYFLRVQKSKLSSDVVAKLAADLGSNQKRVHIIPHQAVSHTWPINTMSYLNKQYKSKSEPRDYVFPKKDGIEFAGTVAFSSVDSHYMLLSRGKLYLVLKSALSRSQYVWMSKVSVGERIEILFEPTAIQLAGQFTETVDAANGPSEPELETVIVDGPNISIAGVVLHSFSDPMVIVRSQKTYFQLNRSLLEASIRRKLDQPGSFVKIRAPSAAISFVWADPHGENRSSRGPETHRRL